MPAGFDRLEGNECPGLGVTVDEDKLLTHHEAYLSQGEFLPYGDHPGGTD